MAESAQMDLSDIILTLLVGKNMLNIVPLLFLRDIKTQTIATSMLILIFTDIAITGFLMFLWYTAWPLPLGLDVVFLRFLCFQNETYWCVSLLLPWVSLNEELGRSYLYRRGCLPEAKQKFILQASLLSLACWMVAASFGINFLGELTLRESACDLLNWRCLFAYLYEPTHSNWLVPCIGLVLGSTLSCSTIMYKDLTPVKEEMGERFCLISTRALLLCLSAAVAFLALPPFLAVNSFSALTLDSLSSTFRIQSPEAQITVHSVQDHKKTSKSMEDKNSWADVIQII